MRFILALCVAGGIFGVTESHATLVDFAPAASGVPADYNENGIVSHSDYAVLGDNWGTATSLPNDTGIGGGNVGSAHFDFYRANYGNTASLPHTSSGLGFSITSAPTVGGNVKWTISFSNVDGAMAGHLSIQVDGGLSAPNIVSANAGTVNQSSFTQPVPGMNTFPLWLTLVDQDPGAGTNNRPQGVQHNNIHHQIYGALGTHLGSSFTDATLTFLTLETEGQQTTTIRVLGGSNNSEYGYRNDLGFLSHEDFFFPQDQVATFTAAVPEGSVILFWSCLTAAAAVCFVRTRKQRTAALTCY